MAFLCPEFGERKMHIDIGERYVRQADQYQYVVREKKVVKEGEKLGSEYLSLVGYYPRISQAISALIHLDVRMSDMKSLQAMQQHLENIASQCEKAFNGAAA